MFRLTSLAVAALLGSAALAITQQPSYSPVNPNRYTAQQPANTGTMPERQTYSNWRQTMTPSSITRNRSITCGARGWARSTRALTSYMGSGCAAVAGVATLVSS